MNKVAGGPSRARMFLLVKATNRDWPWRSSGLCCGPIVMVMSKYCHFLQSDAQRR